MAGICKGAYLLAIFTGFRGLTGATGIIGTVGITGVTSRGEPRVLFKGICAVDEDMRGGL